MHTCPADTLQTFKPGTPPLLSRLLIRDHDSNASFVFPTAVLGRNGGEEGSSKYYAIQNDVQNYLYPRKKCYFEQKLISADFDDQSKVTISIWEVAFCWKIVHF